MEKDFAALISHAPEMEAEHADSFKADGINVRMLTLTPRDRRSDVPHVFLHGGGWYKGSSQASLGLLRRMADHCKRPFVSIDYPLSPEAPYPASIHVTRLALEALAAGNGFAGLVGASAGCHLGLGALRSDSPARAANGLFLMNPALSMRTDTWSHCAFGEEFGLTSTEMKIAVAAYAVPDTDALHDIPSMDLSGLPPVWIACGDRDPLLDDSLRAFKKIVECGGSANLDIMAGGTHGFLNQWFASKRADAMLCSALDWLEANSINT